LDNKLKVKLLFEISQIRIESVWNDAKEDINEFMS
jgi:hypothetical protein